MGFFERYLTVWVGLAIVAGVALGQFAPVVPETLSRFEYAQVSIPVAILIWAMIFPMMAQVDFSAVAGVGRQPKGLVITTAVNWLIKPFTMFVIAWRMVWRLPMANSSSSGSESLPRTMTAFVVVFMAMQTVFAPAAALVAALAVTALLRVFLMM
ncbi:hypothetical protein soil367_18725 (plasmid) [Hydrocarboniclastica marina]|uniref:Arsenical-resistance protein n=1 Tax=Hydrocarboniclastica marina TaxID=2259620 RepID=A0A4P7XNV5_9ALTE|nr:hypothetical protein soil367_18725 [Hydrocarboniclastica marina]